MRHRPELDGIRGVAILGILIDHSIRPSGGGAMGVVLFFVLSGYLITLLLLAEDRDGGVALGRFYVRRWARLTPALWAALLVLAFAPLFWPISGKAAADAIAAAGLYVTNIVKTIDHPAAAVTGWSWSLALEEQFYLVWPITLVVILRRGWVKPAAAVLVVLTVTIVFVRFLYDGPTVYYSPILRSDALLAGCALALWGREIPRWLGMTGVVGLAVLYSGIGITHTMLAVATLVSVLIVGSARSLSTALGWKPLVWLGGISYALYIWNSFLVAMWQQRTGGAQVKSPLEVGVWLLLSFVLAWASTKYVETPVRRWARSRRTGRVQQRPSLATAA